MAKVTINDKEIEVQDGITVLQACEEAGVEIPRFCYHEKLEIAGNCRMCLVEIQPGPPKPAASCAMPVGDGMVIKTDSPMVKKAREGAMEFMLINHPLDCPICDQGGECDLQDQAMTYGRGKSRYKEEKMAKKSSSYGPLIQTQMTRCINCTRCIRFGEQIAGTYDLGATGRGENTEIGTFVGKVVNSELSGNMIDLCPVGALTSKPYMFKARSWELNKTESIDVLDAVGCNIRVDTKGTEVMRILPRLNEDINEEWISDKTRFAYDGLKTQRLDRPYVKKAGKLQPASWEEAYEAIEARISGLEGKQIAAIAGDLADCESMTALKIVMESLGSPNIDCRQDGAKLDASNRSSYLFNTTIAGIEESDACLIIGADTRYDAPLVNARLRKRWLQGGFSVANIGPENDLTFKVNNLGQSPEVIEKITSNKNDFAEILKAAEKAIIIVGAGAINRKDGAEILAAAGKLAEKFGATLNILHKAASRVGGLDLGFVPSKGGKDVDGILNAAEKGDIKVVYLLGADEIDTDKLKDTFVIYQGHHGDAGAHAADVILPGAAYTEKSATYVNLEGRPQRTNIATFPPGEAKEDRVIIKELAEELNIEFPDDIRAEMEKIAPQLAKINEIIPAKVTSIEAKGKISNKQLENTTENFYMTDPICRASKTMAACTAEFLDNVTKEEAA
jgi:NADH-quinone oxidoreductase subunit G